MLTTSSAAVDPWLLEILVVRHGSHTDGERSALQRGEARGLLLRIAHGAYVERVAFESLDPEAQHVVRMRAHAAVSGGPVVFSHWSAAVLHGLPVLRSRLQTLHVTVSTASTRSGIGATGHVFRLQEQEVVAFAELLVTDVGRTVVDVAGAAPFEEGVMAADGALRAGVPRELLREAIDLAGPRRASRRIADVVDFAHPGAESAAESRFRVTSLRLGLEVPVLQFRIELADGSAYLDALFPHAGIGVEVDGDRKYLDPAMATEGTGRALLAEKRREDEVRTHLRALVRIGWVQAGSAAVLRGVLARVGLRPRRPRPTLEDHAAAARAARPRSVPRTTRWRTRPDRLMRS